MQFIVSHIEEETVALQISEIEKLWNLFSRDQVSPKSNNHTRWNINESAKTR